MDLDRASVALLVRSALAEDLDGGRDLTTEAVVPAGTKAKASIVARERLIVAGVAVAREVFHQLDADLAWEASPDGSPAQPGEVIARIAGAARPILIGERTALNFLQRMCGIASVASRCVEEVAGTRAVILDTRKTTPGLRWIEKYAVAAGGAANHRMGLHDAILIKDNHVALAGGVGKAIERATRSGIAPSRIEVEVDDIEGLDAAIACGVGRVLLDNFTPEQAAEAVRRVAGRARVECSGGLTPGRLRPYAQAGADYLSLGCLTHSVRAADIALQMEPLP